jgi:hypothetical protein
VSRMSRLSASDWEGHAQVGDAARAGRNERQDSERRRGPCLLAVVERERGGTTGARRSEERAPSSLDAGVWHGLAIGMGVAL